MSEEEVTETKDKLFNARKQGQAWFDQILEMIEDLNSENDYVSAEQAIQESPLSIEVRSNWYVPGTSRLSAVEYRILLCTGGPAVQISGELDWNAEPETARMEVQDWFTPWTEFRPHWHASVFSCAEILLKYARCFWFGG
jgi:hypothetical protein